jgi:histidyl-tRNA synthetase
MQIEELVYLVAVTEERRKQLFIIANELREKGIPCIYDLRGVSYKAQIKEAKRNKCMYVIEFR